MRSMRWAALWAVVVVLAAGCGGGSSNVRADGGEASEGGGNAGGAGPLAALLAAVDAPGAEPARGSMFMVMDFGGLAMGSLDEPVGTIEVDGDRSHMVMDLSVMAGGFDLGFDPTMEMVAIGTDLYMRAPMFAEVGAVGMPDAFSAFGKLGDGWGYIDTSAFQDLLPEDVAALLGQQSIGFESYLDLVRGVEDVDDGTPSSVNGVPTTCYRAVTNFGEWMQQSAGFDLSSFTELFAGQPGIDEDLVTVVAEAMNAIELVLYVDVDGDGRFRRLDMDIDMASMFDAIADQVGEPVPEGLSMTMSMRVDVDEYGADVVIEAPTGEMIDITKDMRALYEAMF